ncbi:MAG: hypothetical protein WCK90_02405 [archaeon]
MSNPLDELVFDQFKGKYLSVDIGSRGPTVVKVTGYSTGNPDGNYNFQLLGKTVTGAEIHLELSGDDRARFATKQERLRYALQSKRAQNPPRTN